MGGGGGGALQLEQQIAPVGGGGSGGRVCGSEQVTQSLTHSLAQSPWAQAVECVVKRGCFDRGFF